MAKHYIELDEMHECHLYRNSLLRTKFYQNRTIFAARCYASAAYVVMRCLSLCVSVTFVNCVKTNKHINIFSPSGRTTILVFLCQTACQYSDGTLPPPLTGASNAGGVGRNRDFEPISGLTACVNTATGQVL